VIVQGNLGRRAWLLGAAAALACSRSERASGRAPPTAGSSSSSPRAPVSTGGSTRLLEWQFGARPWGEARAAVIVPTWGAADARFPVVVALHGRGEALKAPAEGAMGWARDYALLHAYDRLRSPPLVDADYQGLSDPARLAETNASLATRPFGGVIVACPWLPDFRPPPTVDIGAYARFLIDDLLPRVRRETPALSAPESTGIDGVSLGGIIALRIGLSSPDVFAAVGGIQPALQEGQNAKWTALAQSARERRPGLKLRLLTSHDDYFRAAILSVSQAWRASGIDHDFVDVPGPHDYVFNRGPGSIELLLWHDRALARA